MSRRPTGVALLVLGLAVLLVAAFADALGLGSQAGIGWLQGLGIAVGVVTTIAGATLAMGDRAPGP